MVYMVFKYFYSVLGPKNPNLALRATPENSPNRTSEGCNLLGDYPGSWLGSGRA